MLQYLQSLVAYIGDHPHAAIIIVFLISAGEALFIIGLFIPSTVVLVGAGALIGMGKLSFLAIFVSASLGAIAGDTISYWLGHHYKQHIRDIWPVNRYTGLLDKGEMFFARHGGKSIFIGRFIPGVKAVIPGIAGMAGMNPVRFAIINVMSGVAWAASHLLPGLGIGRGIGVAQSGNPRLLELLLVLAIAMLIAWYVTKFSFAWLLPHAVRVRSWAIAKLTCSRSRYAVTARRLIANEDNYLVVFALSATALLLLSGFVLVALKVFADPELLRSDTAISTYLQTLRTPLFDHFMVAVTMAGDGIVLSVLAVAVIATLVWGKNWQPAIAVTLAFASAAVFVPLMKALIHRDRPISLYDGADAFSFPSGHATMSATIIAISAIIIAHDFSTPVRRGIYLGAAVLVSLVGFSRLYLAAHWPSDVIAGLLFGGSLVFITAWLLHGKNLYPASRRAAVLALVGVLCIYPYRLHTTYSTALALYQPSAVVTTINSEEWQTGKSAGLQDRRVLLDGEYGEPFSVQTDLDIAYLSKQLEKAGWVKQDAGQFSLIISAVLPSSAGLDNAPVLPLTNVGQPPVATFTRRSSGLPDQRDVLRVWDGGIRILKDGSPKPLLYMSVIRERIEPVLAGYALVEPSQLTPEDLNTVMSPIVRLFDAAEGSIRYIVP